MYREQSIWYHRFYFCNIRTQYRYHNLISFVITSLTYLYQETYPHQVFLLWPSTNFSQYSIMGVTRLLQLLHIFSLKGHIRRVWRYQRSSQNPQIEEVQIIQWRKEKVQKDKQRSTKHTCKTKDRVARIPLIKGEALLTVGYTMFGNSEHRKMRAKQQHVWQEMNQYMINANRKWILSFGIEWTIGVKYKK
jgi:hypothetical protein